MLQWLGLIALVSYSTQVVTRSDLPMYALLATRDGLSLKNDVVINLAHSLSPPNNNNSSWLLSSCHISFDLLPVTHDLKLITYS